MDNLIVGVILAIILGAAIYYIYKEKKKGVRCVGCPYAGECAAKAKAAGGSCGCPSDAH